MRVALVALFLAALAAAGCGSSSATKTEPVTPPVKQNGPAKGKME